MLTLFEWRSRAAVRWASPAGKTSVTSVTSVRRSLAALMTSALLVGALAVPASALADDHHGANDRDDHRANTLIATTTVSATPVSMVVDHNTDTIYVADVKGVVTRINEKTNKITGTIDTGAQIQGMAIDSRTATIWAANPDTAHGNKVSVISTKTNTVVNTIPVPNPHGVAVNPKTGNVFVTNYFNGTVSVIDEETNTVTHTLTVGAHPQEVAVDGETGTVYATNYSPANTVSVIDERTFTVTHTIPVGSGPWGIALDAGLGKVYVENYFSSNISVIDVETSTVIHTIADGTEHPLGIAVDRANGFVYAANLSVGPSFANDTKVLVIDARTDAITNTITVAPAPSPVAVDPTFGRVFVASHGGNTVSVIQAGDRHRDDH